MFPDHGYILSTLRKLQVNMVWLEWHETITVSITVDFLVRCYNSLQCL